MTINLKEILLSLSRILDFNALGRSGISDDHIKRSALISAVLAGFIFNDDDFKLYAFSLSILKHLYASCQKKPICKTSKLFFDKSYIHYFANSDILSSNLSLGQVINDNILLSIVDISDAVASGYSTSHIFCSSIVYDIKIEGILKIKNSVSYILSKKSYLEYSEEQLFKELDAEIPDKYMDIDLLNILSSSEKLCHGLFGSSSSTFEHCKGLSSKTYTLCEFYKKNIDESCKLTIAGYLHDIGKLAIPAKILEKPGRLTEDEFTIIKTHVHYTKLALAPITVFEDITAWACNHHEKLNGSGYPAGLRAKELDFNSRLLCCLDIYQALTENRPYRDGLSHNSAVEILKNMCISKETDENIVKDIDLVFKCS